MLYILQAFTFIGIFFFLEIFLSKWLQNIPTTRVSLPLSFSRSFCIVMIYTSPGMCQILCASHICQIFWMVLTSDAHMNYALVVWTTCFTFKCFHSSKRSLHLLCDIARWWFMKLMYRQKYYHIMVTLYNFRNLAWEGNWRPRLKCLYHLVGKGNNKNVWMNFVFSFTSSMIYWWQTFVTKLRYIDLIVLVSFCVQHDNKYEVLIRIRSCSFLQ